MVTARQEKILEEARKAKFIKISELAEIMDTSPVTIRKDVAALAQDNLVVKYHGKISL